MFGLKSNSLFSDTKKLEREIDGFVDILSEVGLVFKSIVPTYLNNSANGKFDEMVEKVKEMESKADKITKEVEHTLYEETLIEQQHQWSKWTTESRKNDSIEWIE